MMEVESKSIDRNEVLERLARMKRELARKERKLERSKRAQRARAHVKQKLREQALIEGSGQSPSLDLQGDSDQTTQTLLQTCSINLTSQQNTDENSSNSGRNGSIQRETTPVLTRTSKLSRPFLARLGQDNSQSLPSNIDGNYQTFKSDVENSFHYVLEGYRRNGSKGDKLSVCSADNTKINTEEINNEELSYKQCKITISPDLLEDFPIITSKTKKTIIADDGIVDNSLRLTPAIDNGKSARKSIQRILQNTENDLKDVKLKLNFELETAFSSRDCPSTEKLKRLSHSSPLDMNDGYPNVVMKKQLSNHQEQDDDCVVLDSITPINTSDKYVSLSQIPQREKILSLNKKRKSCEYGEQSSQNSKKLKFGYQIVESSDHIQNSENEQKPTPVDSNFERDLQKEIDMENAHTEKIHLSQYDCHDAQTNNDSVTVVSDSVSPEPSQSILKPAEAVTVMKESSKESSGGLKITDIKSKVAVESLASVTSEEGSVSHSEKQGRGKKRISKQRQPKTSVISPQTVQDGSNYLDFTELDVIPFSQFQYSDCLFSSQDILSESIPGKKGRKSHFGMLVQRRSPRLSSGLQNIVGDDVKSEHANSMSSTVSDIQNTGSSHSSELPFPPPEHFGKAKRGGRKSKKGIMISSVFQFIIDEAKRLQEVQEFSLPVNIFNKKLKKRLTSSASYDVQHGKLVKPIANGERKLDCGLLELKKFKKENKTDLEMSRFSQEKDLHLNTVQKLAGVESESLLKMSVKMEDISVTDKNCRNLSLLNEISIFDTVRENSEFQTVTSTPKPKMGYLSMPKHEPCCFTTPKHPEADLFLTPKQQIRRYEGYKMTISPSLFPSQEGKEEFPLCSPVSASKASPLGVADLPEDGNCDVDDVTNFTNVMHIEEPIVTYCEEEDTERRTLKTVCSFQTGKSEPVISVLCGVLHTAASLVDFVVALSSSSLGIWSLEGSVWTNELDWILPSDCEANKARLIPSEDKVVVLVTGSSVKIPVLISVFVYDWLSGESTRFNLPLSVSHARPMRDGICCLLTDRQIAVFYRQSSETIGQKLTLNSSFTTAVDDISLESVKGHLTSVCPVEDLGQAVVGLTLESIVHIWNHESGLLLQSVDISICCPSAEHLESVNSEQGFLLLTVFSSKGDKPVSLIAVNPVTAASSQMLLFDKAEKWEGMRASAVYEDFLLASDNSGSLILWDTCSGQLVANLTDLQTSCLAVDLSKEQIFSGQEDGCVHIYQMS